MLKKLKRRLALYLLIRIKRSIRDREPDVTVGDNYLRRWHILPENNFLNVYYHEIRASDLDRHLHDHPYFFSSFILEGGYYEHSENGTVDRSPGDLNLHNPLFLHRLEMKDENGANTIFITGPKIRKWGFKTEDGWVPNDEYLSRYGIQGAFMKPISVKKEDETQEKRKVEL